MGGRKEGRVLLSPRTGRALRTRIAAVLAAAGLALAACEALPRPSPGDGAIGRLVPLDAPVPLVRRPFAGEIRYVEERAIAVSSGGRRSAEDRTTRATALRAAPANPGVTYALRADDVPEGSGVDSGATVTLTILPSGEVVEGVPGADRVALAHEPRRGEALRRLFTGTVTDDRPRGVRQGEVLETVNLARLLERAPALAGGSNRQASYRAIDSVGSVRVAGRTTYLGRPALRLDHAYSDRIGVTLPGRPEFALNMDNQAFELIDIATGVTVYEEGRLDLAFDPADGDFRATQHSVSRATFSEDFRALP